MKKILCIFLSLFVITSFSSAIKISPTQRVMSMEKYGTECTNIWVLPESNYEISSKWSKDGEGDLSKYNLTPEEIKLKINHSYISEGKYEICFTSELVGNFSGIMYFYDEKSRVEIGSWIDLRIRGEETSGTREIMDKISLISGKAIEGMKTEEYFLGGIFVALIIILALVLILNK